MAAHIETRDCGCRIKHERVYVCERHAQLPEDIRDRLSEMVSKVIVDEIKAAVALERERCAKIAEAMTITGHSVQAPACSEIAKKIRSGD